MLFKFKVNICFLFSNKNIKIYFINCYMNEYVCSNSSNVFYFIKKVKL